MVGRHEGYGCELKVVSSIDDSGDDEDEYGNDAETEAEF